MNFIILLQMPEEENKPKKKVVIPVPPFVVYLITVVKGASVKYLQTILVAGLMIFSGWMIYGVIQITSMPRKYRQLITIDSLRDIKDREHRREDSLNDRTNTNLYFSLKHQVDSVSRVQGRFIYKMWYRIDSLSVKNNKYNLKPL